MGNNTAAATRVRPSNTIRLVAVLLAVLLVSVVVVQRSQSAFSGTTSYGNGTLGTSTVSLSNTSAQAFDIGDMIPGDTVVRCVDVRYDGSTTGARLGSVRSFGSDNVATGSLGDYLDIKGEMGPVGSTCASNTTWAGGQWLGKMSDQFAAHGTYANAYDTAWRPAATGESRPFRFTVTLPAATGNEAQGKTAKPVITWEIRTAAGTTR